MKPLWLSVPAALRGPRRTVGEARRGHTRLILPESSRTISGPALTPEASWRDDWFDWDVLVVGDTKPVVLERHVLDVALSVGRHAAERASLAGVGRLVALVDDGPGDVPGTESGRLGLDQWSELGRVALVGLCVAAAQLGLPLRLIGSGAGAVVALASALHPGVRDWCCACAAPEPDGERVLTAQPSEQDAQPA